MDTPEEIDALADRIKGVPPRPPQQRTQQTTADRTNTTVADVVTGLSSEQKALLRFVLEAAGKATDASLRSALSLEHNKQISGMSSGITKRLSAAGISAQILTSEYQQINGMRTYRYQIPSEVESEVRKGLGM